MPDGDSDRPWETLTLANATRAAWYMLDYDRAGTCTSPRARAAALAEARSGAVTDVYVFAHGWNNDWDAAMARYRSFIAGMSTTAPPAATGHVPLLIGIFWPSSILTAPWEQAPAIAGAGTGPGETDADVDEIAALLPPAAGGRLTALLRSDALDAGAAREVAQLVAPLYDGGDTEAADAGPAPTPEQLLDAWAALAGDGDDTPGAGAEGGSLGTVGDAWTGVPRAAAFSLDPRPLIRLLTVRTMKDRAGVVGAEGVGPLLHELLATAPVRVHMIGHSYGCKLCLSAICHGTLPAGTRVDSLLLLQPAVNHRCFADDAHDGRPGGYRGALERVRAPIRTTYSTHDSALRTFFALALRRRADALEAAIAASTNGAPSRFAALGGYGPHGAESHTERVALLDPGASYRPHRPGTRLLAIDASRGISDHGDISNPYTWWALRDQVAQP